METVKVNKNGCSKAVNLPAQFCKKIGIRIGDYVDVTLTVKDQIIIIKHERRGKPSDTKEKS